MMLYRDGLFVDDSPSVVPPAKVPGVFTTVGCEGGRPLLWERHLARLHDSMRGCAFATSALLPAERQLVELLESEALGDAPARIRVVIWWDGEGNTTCEASVSPAAAVGPDRDAISLEVVHWSTPPNPERKWLDRWPWHEALREARSKGRDDALLVDGGGHVLETSVHNIFARHGRRVTTPPAPKQCLPGVMRQWVLERLEAAEAELELERLMAADEVFCTNAVAGVVRVGSIGSRNWTQWSTVDELKRLTVPAPGWARP